MSDSTFRTWGEGVDYPFSTRNTWRYGNGATTAYINTGHFTRLRGRGFPMGTLQGQGRGPGTPSTDGQMVKLRPQPETCTPASKVMVSTAATRASTSAAADPACCWTAGATLSPTRTASQRLQVR